MVLNLKKSNEAKNAFESMFTQTSETAMDIAISDLIEIENQPFDPYTKEKLSELSEDISRNGLFSPLIVRPVKNGKYVILSGRNRKRACEQLDYKTVKCYVKNISDTEADLILLNSNLLQRELKPSEKARAYAMKHKILKEHKALKQVEDVSDRTLQRYVYIGNHLLPEIFSYWDNGTLGLNVVYIIASLPDNTQKTVLEALDNDIKLTPYLLSKMKNQYSFTLEDVLKTIQEEKAKKRHDVVTQPHLVDTTMTKLVSKPFPIDINLEDLRKVIEFLVDEKIIV
ncbi:ParB/RepB/Spo0J family partition protein [Carnobacteriaceae bacterium zg-ZUI78]|nr:ParB/RepB/Spo0J family partition protein [Carnobacteriaceae bacterium zg-ZUI78]